MNHTAPQDIQKRLYHDLINYDKVRELKSNDFVAYGNISKYRNRLRKGIMTMNGIIGIAKALGYELEIKLK